MLDTRNRLLIIAFHTTLLAAFLLLLYGVLVARHEAQRGVWWPGEPLPAPSDAPSPLGATVALEQYESEAALDEALDEAEAMGLVWLRQELPWDAIEAAPGQWQWERWDRLIEAAHGRGFRLLLVLNRTPAWARQPQERDNPLAPPATPDAFVRFARAAAERYGNHVVGWQVWDEPNLMPHWGTEVILDPAEYAAFLAAVAPALREADPDGIVATAGLAPTSEPGGFNMSEIRFLDGLYTAGAAPHFDAVALKPYGFWTGAEARHYDEGTLNFDRVVLLRETMERHGDASTPVWFVEGGWATLPPDWQGEPPPWGSDVPAVQQARLERALRRTALEWPWVQVAALQPLQPAVPATDPRWGLALLDATGHRTPLGETTTTLGTGFFGGEAGAAARQAWALRLLLSLRRYDWALGLVLGAVGALGARLAWHGLALPWAAWGAAFRRRPEAVQIAILAALAMLFYVVDNRVIALLLYAALAVPIAWRLDLGLAAVAFAIPFFLQPKSFGPLQFSMVELLLVLCALVWLLRGLTGGRDAARRTEPRPDPAPPGMGWLRRLRWQLWHVEARLRRSPLAFRLARLARPHDALDWALLLFALWAALSVLWAQNFGVASREFRVVVAESVLWFWLVRRAGLTEAGRLRLVDALVASATLVALYGLFQWLVTGDIITAEGVRRIRGVYGSPNNLALMLERVIPLAAALVLLAPPSPRRWLYGAALLPLAACLFLTFSRGAWLLGMPTALLWLAWWGGARTRRWVGALGAAALVALLPFAATERLASTTDLDGGTWFIRFRLWEATLAMLRDFPLLGVGLDNFLYAYDAYRLPDAWREPDLSHPHQIFLHFWVALGLPGLALLLWQQWIFWGKLFRRRALPDGTVARALLVGLGASMAATVAHGLIDNSYFLVDLAFIWTLTLALVAELPEARPL